MGQDALRWESAGEGGKDFLERARSQPGWYWVLRPHQDGPGRWNPEKPVMCPIHVFPDGKVSSPLADLRKLDGAQLAPCNPDGTEFPSWFAGPMVPGASSGKLSVEEGRPTGDAPPVPGWYWCRTNPEAPLLHVDAEGIGPILLDRGPNGDVHVWSTAYLDQTPVDVGELGFSEPLTSPGGVIDASGELNRNAVEFFGPVPQPASAPSAPWAASSPTRTGVAVLALPSPDHAAAAAALGKLGFELEGEVWAGLGIRIRLVPPSAGVGLELPGTPELGTILGIQVR